jgi:ankyrin repeat protein
VNAKDDGGGTPLHFAVTKEIAELLIAEGADVNAKGDVNGSTPLHQAAYGISPKRLENCA